MCVSLRVCTCVYPSVSNAPINMPVYLLRVLPKRLVAAPHICPAIHDRLYENQALRCVQHVYCACVLMLCERNSAEGWWCNQIWQQRLFFF